MRDGFATILRDDQPGSDPDAVGAGNRGAGVANVAES